MMLKSKGYPLLSIRLWFNGQIFISKVFMLEEIQTRAPERVTVTTLYHTLHTSTCDDPIPNTKVLAWGPGE